MAGDPDKPEMPAITPEIEAADMALLAELKRRAPGCSVDEYAQLFVALREEYGEHALEALRDGAVRFEPREQGDG